MACYSDVLPPARSGKGLLSDRREIAPSKRRAILSVTVKRTPPSSWRRASEAGLGVDYFVNGAELATSFLGHCGRKLQPETHARAMHRRMEFNQNPSQLLT